MAGAGGFIDISQNARKVLFLGTFTAGDLELSVVEGKLLIERDGQHQKFVEEVGHRTFSGPHAAQQGKDVLYITERCVFRLTTEGLELTEIAPGIDIDRDILAKMAFKPIVHKPREMDRRIFRSDPMGLREGHAAAAPGRAVRLRPGAQHLVPELRGSPGQVDEDDRECPSEDQGDLRAARAQGLRRGQLRRLRTRQRPGRRLPRRRAGNGDTYFHGVTRFTTSAFMRAKLGDALESRGVAPHIYETEDEAAGAVRTTLAREE